MKCSKAVIFFFGCAAAALAAFAPFRAAAADAAQASGDEQDKALQDEIDYISALVENGYPDFAADVIAATKKKWPASEAALFPYEISGMLSLGQFEEAEKKVAALPDRKSSKYWSARLVIANNLFFRGRKDDCSKIYSEFFKAYPKPSKDIREFYKQASYTWGQILVDDKRYREAAKVYEGLLPLIDRRKSDEDASTWCNVACETAEMYLKLATDEPDRNKRKGDISAAKKLVDQLLWQPDQTIYFGRAIAMKANIELLNGSVAKAQQTISEYMGQLEELHKQIVAADPDGRRGLLKLSPMPLCRFMLARLLWNEAKDEFKKSKRDDERVKSLLFGEKTGTAGRRNSLGAFNHAYNVFIQYPECTWAADAGRMADEIKAFAEKNYNANIQAKISPEQYARVRQMQFRAISEKMAEGKTEEAIKEYLQFLASYPEEKESIRAIRDVVQGYLDLIYESRRGKGKSRKDDKAEGWRLDADAVEGYLVERFAGSERELMTAAGDAVLGLAAQEKQRGQLARADRLYGEFLTNYRLHVSAATTASQLLGEAMVSERWTDAIRYCKIVQENYTNSLYYAASFAQESYCLTKLDERAEAIAAMKRYVEVEKDGVAKEQARMALAQMYQKEGFDILAGAETNETEEAVSAALKAGSDQIVRGILEFQQFAKKADKALADPSLTTADKAKYSKLKEQALFLVGECWRRMTKPEDKLEVFRQRAAQSYESYLAAYPESIYSTNAYVRLGTIYTALGDLEKSKDALDRLSKAFPDSPEAKNAKPQLAKALIEMGLKKEGTAIYAEMLGTDGAYTAAQFVSAGNALVEAQSWDLANEAFEKAIQKAGTNSYQTVARARVGQANALYRRKAYAEARDALDQFLDDRRMSRMSIAVDATRLLIEVASEQGRTEKDAEQRDRHFGAAIGALRRLRGYWQDRPKWEQDSIDLMSAEVRLRRMAAEEGMGLGDEAVETGKSAAATLLGFLQAHCIDENHPADKMTPGEMANLERCYELMVPLYAKIGSEYADDVARYGQEYFELFPNGKARTEVQNAMNKAKADGAKIPVPAAKPEAPAAEAAPAPEAEAPAAETAPAPEAESAPANN